MNLTWHAAVGIFPAMCLRHIVAVLFLAIASVGAIQPGHICTGSGTGGEDTLHQLSYVSTASSRRLASRSAEASFRQPCENRRLCSALAIIPESSFAALIIHTPVSQHQLLTI
jgi:hypothetical protein